MITAVVGGQFGSEGKGAVVGHIARDYGCHVRVGAANAGHTLYVDGEKHVVQQLPCAAYANPSATLVLGPGALISPGILIDEINENAHWRKKRDMPPIHLFIDQRAQIVTQRHIEIEQEGDLAERIGSTSTIAREGIGAAAAARVARDKTAEPIGQDGDLKRELDEVTGGCGYGHVESPYPAREADGILLEGTQGTGLSLTTGFFPYVTSRNPTAAGLAADCAIGPKDLDEVILVCRTFPIRVHGPSGPFYSDSTETSFEAMGVPAERTTVTKLERRVATFSMQQVYDAVRINSATKIALTFTDYMAPSLSQVDDFEEVDFSDPDVIDFESFMVKLERFAECPVWLLGTGPDSVIERYPKRDVDGARLGAKLNPNS